MNVQVKHNGTDISGFVLSYERVHKICTGIGTLIVELAGTINRTFDPWDTIDVYENGSLQVRYYVSVVEDSVPSGSITLDCQDISKRLVDYFISETYTIDYPSYTRYWIELFLAEAGLNYQIMTSSQGQLLSNFTQLGLAPAYEQLMTLLQLSGWYMYFDGNGKAIIGPLDADLASLAGSVGDTDIIKISKVSDDKMLRNRALVLGAYDPIRQEQAHADITVKTRWNYDSRDLRTMVVSNSNIPNSSSAAGIANRLIKEFARITVEKHLTLWGARDYNLGRALKVRDRVWSGRGLITTFGVSMGKEGLVTNIILDERCPRLFGFFDFGDYVYVGTYGDGIWRKHMKFDHTWYNFSTGLTDLRITDLHINNDVFGSVGASGQMYYCTGSDSSWIPLSVTSLQSSVNDQVTGVVEYIDFSGIMARATIVDKLTDHIKFGVDTFSGLNMGDYFLMQSGWAISNSGVQSSGTSRGWIIEYDPYTGAPVGGLGSGIYPISISGNYDITVIDLENDGYNDYVSVKTEAGGTTIEHTDLGYNFGRNVSFLTHTSQSNALVAYGPLTHLSEPGRSYSANLSTAASAMAVFDNESIGEREIVWRSGGALHRSSFSYDINGDVTRTTLTSPTFTIVGQMQAINKIGADIYRGYCAETVWAGAGGYTNLVISIVYYEWNTATNTVGGRTVVSTKSIAPDPFHSTSGTFAGSGYSATFATVNGQMYFYFERHFRALNAAFSDPDWDAKVRNYLEFYILTCDTLSSSGDSYGPITYDFEPREQFLGGKDWALQSMISDGMRLYLQGSSPIPFMFLRNWTVTGPVEHRNYLLYSNDGFNFSLIEIESTTSSSDPAFFYIANRMDSAQLTGEQFIFWMTDDSQFSTYIFNGQTVTISTEISMPFQYQSANIYPLLGPNDTHYIAKNGTDWYFCNPQTFSTEHQLTVPLDYLIYKPYSTTDLIANNFYWQARDPDYNNVILRTTYDTVMQVAVPTSSFGTTGTKAIIVGNFLIDFGQIYNTSANLGVLYLDNQDVPEIGGASYMVLQREGAEFNLLQTESYPIRLDISNGTPLLTVGSGDATFTSFVISGQDVTEYNAVIGLTPQTVEDYRYTLLEPASGISGFDPTASGMGVALLGMYVTGSGIYADNITAYSGFELLYAVPSGYGNRIETTNAALDGQYVFITTSGDYPAFYQKDPTAGFVAYSGLPVSRATIIRVDDYI